jgi:uncharacterized protein (TIGR00251 family)
MYVRVHVVPGSRKEDFRSVSKDTFNISVREPAERNMANKRVIELVARHFKVPSAKLRIINGHKSPTKLISIIDEI